MSFDDIGARIEMEIPHALKQHSARYNSPSIEHQFLKQAKLAWLKVHDVITALHGSFQSIQREVGDLQRRFILPDWGAARQSIQSCV